MSHWTGRIAFVVCSFLACVFAFVKAGQSCADPGDPFEDYSQHPDVPIEKFVQGHLGIVQPTFARSYLVVAYRYASGVPLTNDEQQGAIAVWMNRGIDMAHLYEDGSLSQEGRPKNHYLQDGQDASEGGKDWVDERATVVSSPAPQINQEQGLDNYSQYMNCANDALVTAAATLKHRVKQFGKENPGIREWVVAQDAVFANCGGDPQNPVVPAAPSPALPEILRYDREYQIAAAYMYSNQYDNAIRGFQHIAEERNSPWYDIAPYLVARTMIRQATLDIPKPEAAKYGLVTIPPFVPEKMQAAADYVSKTLAENPHRPFSTAFQCLFDRAEFRLHPAEQTLRLSEQLSRPAPDGRFYDWLTDYTWLLDRRGDTRGDFGQGGSPEEYAKSVASNKSGELTDWVITFQMDSPGATQHALQMWQAHRQSAPWLMAALAKTEAKSPQAAEVLSAADELPKNSPAYVSLFYHRMRLRNGLGKFAEVRHAIDGYLGATPDLPGVAKDYLLNLRLDAASDLDDAVRLLPRGDCSVTNREPTTNCFTTIPEHSAHFLDALPLDLLVQVLHNKNLASADKAKFVHNVWMRAVILGRYDVAQGLDADAFRSGINQNPVPDDEVQKLVRDFASASTPEEKQFAAVFLMQHQYAVGYATGSAIPWCASPREYPNDQTYWGSGPESMVLVPPPPFLTEAERKQAEIERIALDHTDSQANYYVRVVLEFAEKHPDDPRVPEALSRAVKNTRMNCNNNRTGDLSKRAFDLLHNRYPDTTWAKNTKYWYGSGY
jgi:hypothetical protein